MIIALLPQSLPLAKEAMRLGGLNSSRTAGFWTHLTQGVIVCICFKIVTITSKTPLCQVWARGGLGPGRLGAGHCPLSSACGKLGHRGAKAASASAIGLGRRRMATERGGE